ncbi:uncharacterized protein LOC131028107 [Cryptomeria japonica]|uniref:uncharacterized protein LOC131028107 n=1 Tax=Cryptomeria japonica TaxID=3369 RepID=UPI0025AD6D80|nr:uncharacterized protein LOC131028107 [Cryptomeria japonica]
MADYFFVDSSGLVSVARWKSVESLPVDQDLKYAFVEELKKHPFLFFEAEDELIWVHSKSGEYSVKNGYNYLFVGCRGEDLPYRLFWHVGCLPKAGAFAWLAVQDRILIGMRLDRFGVTIIFPCVMCGGSPESVDHLFLHCPFASQCWYWLFNKLNQSVVLCKDLQSQFMGWPLLCSSSFYACLWIIAPSVLIWKIWLERNNNFFKKHSSTLPNVLFCIEKSISESALAFIYKGISPKCTFTSWDNWVIGHWPALQLLPMHGAISKKRSPSINRKEIVWLPPPPSKYKLNFGGAYRGNPRKSTIGVVVFDDRARIIKAQCQCIPDGTNNVAELHALSVGLDLLL